MRHSGRQRNGGATHQRPPIGRRAGPRPARWRGLRTTRPKVDRQWTSPLADDGHSKGRVGRRRCDDTVVFVAPWNGQAVCAAGVATRRLASAGDLRRDGLRDEGSLLTRRQVHAIDIAADLLLWAKDEWADAHARHSYSAIHHSPQDGNHHQQRDSRAHQRCPASAAPPTRRFGWLRRLKLLIGFAIVWIDWLARRATAEASPIGAPIQWRGSGRRVDGGRRRVGKIARIRARGGRCRRVGRPWVVGIRRVVRIVRRLGGLWRAGRIPGRRWVARRWQREIGRSGRRRGSRRRIDVRCADSVRTFILPWRLLSAARCSWLVELSHAPHLFACRMTIFLVD